MADRTSSPPTPVRRDAKVQEDRRRRQAEALRRNLLRRKAQARARSAALPEDVEKPSES